MQCSPDSHWKRNNTTKWFLNIEDSEYSYWAAFKNTMYIWNGCNCCKFWEKNDLHTYFQSKRNVWSGNQTNKQTPQQKNKQKKKINKKKTLYRQIWLNVYVCIGCSILDRQILISYIHGHGQNSMRISWFPFGVHTRLPHLWIAFNIIGPVNILKK